MASSDQPFSMLMTEPMLSMAEPMPFILSDEEGKWHINDEAGHLLSSTKCPLSAVAIVGKYRTGKSYLMNRLFGRNSGFALGNTVQAKTKGIWIWLRPHPQNPDRSLLLVDTEGLHDVESGDETRDMQLFTFAVLLSNCLVYNATGTFDDIIVQQLQLVVKLTENIKLNRKQNDEESGVHFSKVFPFFFLVLRDFFLELKINGEEVTPDQYLEHTLKPKPGYGVKIRQFNAPRECIRAFFPRRRCFTLPKPVDDSEKLRHMELVRNEEINPEFLEESQKVVEAIISEAKPFVLQGNPINGSRFCEIARVYVRVINEGGIPCIESTVDLMKKNECSRALDEACSLYKQSMTVELNENMPVDSETLLEVHGRLHEQAVQFYRENALFDEHGQFIEKLTENLENHFLSVKQENEKRSQDKCRYVLHQCFAKLAEGVSEGQFTNTAGGYAKYRQLKDLAIAQYKETSGLGPMSEYVLNHFLQTTRSEEEAIIQADKALNEREKELALQKEQLQREAEKRSAMEKEQAELRMEFKRQQKEHDSMLRKIQIDFEEKQKVLMADHMADMAQKEKECQALMEQGLVRQAEQYTVIIDEMEQDRKNMQANYELQENALGEYKQQQSAMMDEVRKQRELSNTQLQTLQKELAGLRSNNSRGDFWRCSVM